VDRIARELASRPTPVKVDDEDWDTDKGETESSESTLEWPRRFGSHDPK
jgi:hypothetical protein